jgi:hypothetical protein
LFPPIIGSSCMLRSLIFLLVLEDKNVLSSLISDDDAHV